MFEELLGVPNQHTINLELRESIKSLSIQIACLMYVLNEKGWLNPDEWPKIQAKVTSEMDQIWTKTERDYVEKFIKEQRSDPGKKLLFDMFLRKGLEEQGYKIEDEEDGASTDDSGGSTTQPGEDGMEDSA